MNNTNFRKSKLALLVLAGLNFNAVANDNPEVKEDDVEVISITGSHIKGVDLEGTQPLTVISSEDIARSGASSISELLKDIGATRGGTGSFSTSSSGALQGDSPVGQAAASLRGLGASSTLTLINGRRVAASSFANKFENFVDVNSIPMAAIDRIEILATGASATYGADAVAGVINYILKKDYDGAEINLSAGNSTADSDDQKVNLNFVFGHNFDGGNFTAYVDYYKRNPLYDRDREETANSISPSQQGVYPSVNFDGVADAIVYGPDDVEPDYSIGAGFYDDVVDKNCPEALQKSGRYGEYCEYDQNQYLPTTPNLEQLGGGFNLNIELGDTLWFTEGMFSRTESTSNSTGAPTPGGGLRFDINAPFVPSDLKADVEFNNLDNADYLAYSGFDDDQYYGMLDYYGVDTTDGLVDAMAGDSLYKLWMRFADGRTIENTTTSYRVVTGLEGDLGDWYWKTSVGASSSQSEQLGVAGIINREKFEAALRGRLCADGSTSCYPDEGGLYYNPFNGQQGNEEVLALIEETVPRDGESNLYTWDLHVSGKIMDDISAAFGVEYRKEEISDVPAEIARGTEENGYQPGVYGFGSTGATADRDTWGAFAEFFIPVTDQLSAQVAGRYDHYSDFGGDFNPKVAIRYEATEDLIVRASWATSYRAPSLSQIGAEVTLSSFTLQCSDEFVGNYCADDPDETIFTREVGNENLEAETSTSANLGFAYSPTQDIDITLDYWNFQHEGIVGIDGEYFLRRSLTDPSLRKCGTVPVGELGVGFETCDANNVGELGSRLDGDVAIQLENLGTQDVNGIDFTYTHYVGAFTFLADITHLIEFERQLSPSAEVESLAGTFRYPDTLATLKAKWSGDQMFGGVTVKYTSSYEDDLEGLSADNLADLGIEADRQIPEWTTIDAYLGYDVTDNAEVVLSISNLTDEDAPRAYGTSANVDHYNHDTMGTYYKVDFRYNF